jgi:hypothetical protein
LNKKKKNSSLSARQYRSIMRDCQEQLDVLAETASAAQVPIFQHFSAKAEKLLIES